LGNNTLNAVLIFSGSYSDCKAFLRFYAIAYLCWTRSSHWPFWITVYVVCTGDRDLCLTCPTEWGHVP